MKIQYDREADALYIQLRRAKPHHNVEVPEARGISIDVDREGRIVGIEVLDASKLLGEDLGQVTVENLLTTLPVA